MLKYLRIAVTALSLTACVFLIALWVRSYWWNDIARCPLASMLIDPSVKKYATQKINGEQSFHVSQLLVVHSFGGRLMLQAGGQSLEAPGWFPSYWGVISYSYKDLNPRRDQWRPPAFGYGFDRDGRKIRFPYWFAVVLIATFAVIPWFPWSRHFSLRTLLIATTLVAVGLSVIVALTKWS
jgi:hypothetical protein